MTENIAKYREIIVKRTYTSPVEEKLVLKSADICITQPNGRKKHYKEVPSAYLKDILNTKNIVLNRATHIPEERVSFFEQLMNVEEVVAKDPVSLDDFLNRISLLKGRITTRQLRNLSEKYNWKGIIEN